MVRKLFGFGLAVALMSGVYGSENDFNGDGFGDILWNKNNKGYTIWLMGTGGKVGEIKLPKTTSLWRVAATDDYNGDGITDILWQTGKGRYLIWTMGAGGKTGVITLKGTGLESWYPGSNQEEFQAINYDMIKGKAFYLDERDEDDDYTVEYYKLSFINRKQVKIHYIEIDKKTGQIMEEAVERIPYKIVNGQILFNSPDEKSRFTLIHRKSDVWYVRGEYDEEAIGAYSESSKGIMSFYLKKPKNYPSGL